MNTNEYLAALENLISKLQQLSFATPVQISEAVAELCCVLKIGKIEVTSYESEASEHLGLSETQCYYDCGSSDSSGCISRRIVTIDEKIAVYTIFIKSGESEWTDEERRRIDIFLSLFSTFSGKFRLIKLTQHLTFFDSELNIHNLKQFMKCARKLCRSGMIDNYTAVRFNLKRFSVVNQHIGRESGTLVMQRFLGYIAELLDDKNENICRIGGDNFITLIKSYKLQNVLKILNGSAVTYDEKRNERINISATAGVYIIQDNDSVILPADIMDRVSMAYNIAKNSANTDVAYFDDMLLARSKRNNDITVSFPKALEDREFLVYYQPKIALNGRNIAGAEALCRWMHNGNLVSPGEFIPVLEQGRDICKLDFYMLDAVCKDIRRWLDSGKKVVRVSVNLSRRHLSDMDLLEHIVNIVDKNNVPHEYIEIELTETTTDVEFKDLKRTIGGLQKTGGDPRLH